jgi:hypothetical protein
VQSAERLFRTGRLSVQGWFFEWSSICWLLWSSLTVWTGAALCAFRGGFLNGQVSVDCCAVHWQYGHELLWVHSGAVYWMVRYLLTAVQFTDSMDRSCCMCIQGWFFLTVTFLYYSGEISSLQGVKRFWVLMVHMKGNMFCNVPFSLVNRWQRFRGTCQLYL